MQVVDFRGLELYAIQKLLGQLEPLILNIK